MAEAWIEVPENVSLVRWSRQWPYAVMDYDWSHSDGAFSTTSWPE